jgi:integrase/recombinase XerD
LVTLIDALLLPQHRGEEWAMPMSRVRASGPLQPFRDGFRRALESDGYSPGQVELYLALFSQLSGWLGERGLGPEGLTAEIVIDYLAVRRARYGWLKTVRSLAPVMQYLRSAGAAPMAVAEGSPSGPVEELLAAYRQHLVSERALSTSSVDMYVRGAATFLRAWWPDDCDSDVGHIARLDAAAVVRFVRRDVARLAVPSAQCLVTALRSFLRFLHARGFTPRPLAAVVPGVARWQGASMPRAVSAEFAAGLVASCDIATPIGRRDVAILTVLLRLGLRAGEVAQLRLDDLDWRAGEITVRGKGSRVDRLPVMADVGEAIVAYLADGRPRTSSRDLFLRSVAPYVALTRYGVRSVVYHACDRAGLPRLGPHRLRHTAGTETLRAGASLTEVGQLLRHRSPQTTATYAKVDHALLRNLAQPWPGAAA